MIITSWPLAMASAVVQAAPSCSLRTLVGQELNFVLGRNPRKPLECHGEDSFFRKLTNAKACDISLRYQPRSLGQAILFHEETVLREAKPVKLVLDKFWN
jgi:hypothetical protein